MCLITFTDINYVFASKDQNLKISITLFTDKYLTVLLCALKFQKEKIWGKEENNPAKSPLYFNMISTFFYLS